MESENTLKVFFCGSVEGERSFDRIFVKDGMRSPL